MAVVTLCAARISGQMEETTPERLAYPAARRGDQTDDYHEIQVADPYRWLEDADSAETRAWVEAQNRLTFDYLAGIPAREGIRDRLAQLWNYERSTPPFREGGRYFYSRNTGLQNQDVWYVAESPEAEPRVLLDPNALSADGTVALAGMGVSEDGRYLAYALASGGSDWQEWRVRDVTTGQDLADHLQWSKFSEAAWTHDRKGFFYSRYDAPPPGRALQHQNFYHKLYYHRLGTPQAADILVYDRPDQKEWFLHGSVSEDGRYLLIEAGRGTDPVNRIFYKDFKDPLSPTIRPEESAVTELLTAGDAQYFFLGNDGPLFWFLTDNDAPRRRVIAVDIRNPQPAEWREVVPQAADNLVSVRLVGDRFFALYLRKAHSQVEIFDLDGQPQGEVALPGIGTVSGFGGKRDDRETYYQFQSFAAPPTIYRFDIAQGRSTLFRRPQVAFDPDAFETKQVFYESEDGTSVPMFLTHLKGLKRTGNNPAYLYGYGGFQIAITPSFSPENIAWMEMGGIYAVASLRGGGEFGREWYEAGRLKNKQNVFDDFIAAAEWLIANKYTSSAKLAIGGSSNGGLLVGACMTQRPDLFGAALPDVGVMDMLRFHKFTIGWGWTSDFGSPDDPEEFRVLYAYSPLHLLKPGTKYPATLVTTSDHDDRVVPAHSFKFVAALQAAQAGEKPTLIRIETRAGHGGGKPTAKIIEEIADQWAFLTRALGMK